MINKSENQPYNQTLLTPLRSTMQKEMATRSSILAWRTAVDPRAWQAPVHGVCEESDASEATEDKKYKHHYQTSNFNLINPLPLIFNV